MEIRDYILIALSVGQLLLLVIGFYKMFRDPDEKAERDISNLKEGCLLKHERIDEVIAEPLGGAHRDVDDMTARLKAKLIDTLQSLKKLSLDELTDRRYQKFMAMGACD